MRALLRALTDALEGGGERIVCQVVQTRGSTPQKAGAWMVLDPDGGRLGTLGGGCVEGEVISRAGRRLGAAGVELQTFILDHDYAWADGLICGGKMVIATEAVRGAGPLAYFQAYQRLLEAGDGLTEAVVIEPSKLAADVPAGSRFLFGPDGTCAAAWPSARVPAGLGERVAPLAERPKTAVCGGVAFLPTLPRVRLLIAGAGHVGQAVGALAAQADFAVWVVDDRSDYANRERFPAAERFVVGPFDEVLPHLEVTPHTYALIVTRGHGHDEEALYHLAPTAAAYVGLIGSRRKIRLIFESLRDLGIAEESLRRVAAPVGLDIGSQTVPEIAVSVVAELIARRNLGPAGLAPREDLLSRRNAEPVPAPAGG